MSRSLSECVPPWRTSVCPFLLIAVFAAPVCGQSGSSGSNVEYIDSAIPSNVVRQRVEAVYRINRSDRALYIYSPGFDPRIDYQDSSQYVEMAFGGRVSGFVELHQHFVNPEQAPNDKGLGDTIAGFKWAFLADEHRFATFQLKTYIPTGNPEHILGTGHASLEPAFLYLHRLSDRLTVEGEIRDWIPFGGDPVAGNIVRYGVGLSYVALQGEKFRVTPVLEFVGWTVLGGMESVGPNLFKDAAGDTIVNAKLGVRLGCGRLGDLYLGYGRALTGAVWYKDLARLEYRFFY